MRRFTLLHFDELEVTNASDRAGPLARQACSSRPTQRPQRQKCGNSMRPLVHTTQRRVPNRSKAVEERATELIDWKLQSWRIAPKGLIMWPVFSITVTLPDSVAESYPTFTDEDASGTLG